MQKYEEFLARKAQDSTRYGFAPVWMPDFLFDFQGSALEWHLVKGRSAALLDCGTAPPTRVFESGAILLYLAEKFDAFLPRDSSARAECFSWLFWQMGSAPYLGGGFGHFYAYAPEKIEYCIDRYAMEVKRQLDVLDRNLSTRRYLCGDAYSIADIATYPWYGSLVLHNLYKAAEFPCGARGVRNRGTARGPTRPARQQELGARSGARTRTPCCG